MSAINTISHPRAWVGITVALAAAAGFALANTSASVAYQGGSNPLTVAATRFLVPTAALIVWLSVSGISLVLPKRDAFAAAVLGVITALYTWALLKSFSSIPFALAILIFYLFPLMATVIVASFGWEKFSWKTAAAIVLALAGLALALDVRGGNLNVEGVVLAFFAAIGLAVVIVISSRVFGKGDARPVTLYMAAAASVLLLILCAASRRLRATTDDFGVDWFPSRRRSVCFRNDCLFHCHIDDRTGAHVAFFLRRCGDICRSWRRCARSSADAGPNRRDRARHPCTDRRDATKIAL